MTPPVAVARAVPRAGHDAAPQRCSTTQATTPNHLRTPARRLRSVGDGTEQHAIAVPAERGHVAVPLRFDSGHMRTVNVNYELVGAAELPVLIVLGGISAGRHVIASGTWAEAGWWQGIAGAGCALDARQHRVLSIDWVGREATAGQGPTQGPKLSDGQTPVHHPVSTSDQAVALHGVVKHLGIEHVTALIGASYGAMVGQHFAARYPHLLGGLINISAAHRAHPYGVALRTIQREILRECAALGDESVGLKLARQVALMSYRTADDAVRRDESRSTSDDSTPTVQWLQRCSSRFADTFSAAAFATLSQSIDDHHVDPARIRVPVASLAVDSDQLVTPQDILEFSEKTSGPATVEIIASVYGHDAFLKEPAAVNDFVMWQLAAMR